MAGSPAVAQATFSAWDNDGDGYIEVEEFTDTYVSDVYDDWDLTSENELGMADFYVATFNIVDTDDSNYLDEDEWEFGYNYYYGDYLNDEYGFVDSDSNEVIAYSEYYDALYDSDFFSYWDTDSDDFLSENELAEKVFRNWDLNGNVLLNRSEYLGFDQQYTDF